MKFTRRSCQILAVLLAVPSVVARAEPAQQSFALGRYVPQDVFWLIHGVHNSERDFIAQHWAPVIEEFANCGIELELKRLISGDLSTEDRAEFEQAWDMVFQLVRGVRWGDLMAREVLFAERLGSITPDLMLLCRSKPGSIEANLEGLKAILHALAEISDSATVTETKRRQARVWSLEVEDVPIGLHLFNQDDVVGVIVGHQGLKDVLGLMAGDDQIGSVVDSPRYRKAAGELPAPETTVMFFDAEALVRGMNNMVDVAFARDHHGNNDPDAPEHEGAQRGKRIVHKMIDHANVFDYVMAVTRTEGLREITTSTARMCTEAMDKPFYSMLCNRKPFERFDRYIPENATGFTLSTFLDLELLYETALAFIRTELSDGQSAIATWNQLQDDIGFNLTEDFFSWWSGELVKVTLPPAVKGPFSSADFVWFIRVKDSAKASAKVSAGIDRVATLAREHNQAMMLADVPDLEAEGFRSITHPLLAMQGLKFIVGVTDDHLVIGNSAEAINACLSVAAGKSPSIRENPRFIAEGLVPEGAVYGASFHDLSNLGQEMASGFFMAGMFGQMIPENEETRPLKAMIGILGRLSPVVGKIDFFSSSATVCTLEGSVWKTRQVMNYKPLPAAPPSPPTARSAAGGAPGE